MKKPKAYHRTFVQTEFTAASEKVGTFCYKDARNALFNRANSKNFRDSTHSCDTPENRFRLDLLSE